MQARFFKMAIVVSWLVLMGWFVRYEAFPGFFTNTLEGYRDMLAGGELFVDSWMKITFKDAAIGYSHSQIEVLDDNPLEHYRISSRTALRLNLMGEPQDINVISSGGLDILYHLQKFSFSLSSRNYGLQIEGRRKEGQMFDVHVRSAAGVQVTRIEIPDDVIVYSPMTEMAMGKLKPGEHMRVRTLEPSSMSVADIMIRGLRKEPRKVNGETIDTTVLAVEFQGTEMQTWVDHNGRVVREETPYGWTMDTCSAEEAISLKYDPKTGDALTAMAVPCRGTIQDPRGAKSIRVRLTGGGTQTFVMATSRQIIEGGDAARPIVLLTQSAVPTNTATETASTNLLPYLASTPFVQAEDQAIVSRAKKITEGRTDNLDKARAIFDWVYTNVQKEPTVSLPSAVDVLNRMQGDCNEHTYLFTALARAVGIPTQIRVGLLYKDGLFYYHAWPAVYVGDWMEMDPTLGQEQVDATHIALLEGEMANQLKLLQVFGRMSVEVLNESDE